MDFKMKKYLLLAFSLIFSLYGYAKNDSIPEAKKLPFDNKFLQLTPSDEATPFYLYPFKYLQGTWSYDIDLGNFQQKAECFMFSNDTVQIDFHISGLIHSTTLATYKIIGDEIHVSPTEYFEMDGNIGILREHRKGGMGSYTIPLKYFIGNKPKVKGTKADYYSKDCRHLLRKTAETSVIFPNAIQNTVDELENRWKH